MELCIILEGKIGREGGIEEGGGRNRGREGGREGGRGREYSGGGTTPTSGPQSVGKLDRNLCSAVGFLQPNQIAERHF